MPNETPLNPLSAAINKPSKADFKDFEKNLQNALNAHLPSNRKPYENVNVLLFYFKEADNTFHAELRKFEEHLRRKFNFSTTKVGITDEWTNINFVTKFAGWLEENAKEGNLTIVYYGGHGQHNSDEKSVWKANHTSKLKIVWSNVQSILDAADGEKLVILDCCFAATAGIGATTEMLAACGTEGKAQMPGKRSFTSRLMQAMADFEGAPFTAAMLYARILDKRFRSSEAAMPIHIPCSVDYRPSVWLTKHDSIPALASAPATPAYIRGVEEPWVIITLHLNGDAQLPDMSQWVHFLTSNIPSYVERGEIKIMHVYRSESTIVKVRMPIAIMHTLQPDPSLSFDCFVESDDLFQQLPRTTRRQQERSDESDKTLTEEGQEFEGWEADYGKGAEAAKDEAE